MRLAILILAAGASSRMRGGDKLLETVDGQPLLRLQAKQALAVSPDVIVALPGPDHPRAACIADLPVQTIAVPNASEGMAASIRTGVSALPANTDAVMVLPADMPEISENDLSALAQAWQPHRLLRATAADGRPGHPVVFPADCFHALTGITGDQGAREVIAANRDRLDLYALPDAHALTDLDTPEDWAAWRAART